MVMITQTMKNQEIFAVTVDRRYFASMQGFRGKKIKN